MQGDRDLFVGRCKELGADVKVESANSDDNQQIKDVQSLLTAGVRVACNPRSAQMVLGDGARCGLWPDQGPTFR